MSSYFQDFPVVPYRFGNNELPVEFQHLGTYLDIIDQVKEYRQFYQTYNIQNNERPDHASYKLYGNSTYGWTFYLMNDKLRTQGWPVDNSRVYPLAQEYYPNMVVRTDGAVTAFDDESGAAKNLTKSQTFQVGKYVFFPGSNKAGKILRIDYDLGLLHIQLPDVQPGNIIHSIGDADGAFIAGGGDVSDIDVTGALNINTMEKFETLTIANQYRQYDAPHHYENTVTKEWVYPTWDDEAAGYPFNLDSVTTQQSVSYFQRLREENDELRSISVIKPDSLRNVIAEFNALLRGVN